MQHDLVELGLPGQLAKGPHLDSRVVHVDDEEGQAPVPCFGGAASGEADPPVRELRVRGPDLRAVKDESPVRLRPPGCGPRRGRSRRQVR